MSSKPKLNHIYLVFRRRKARAEQERECEDCEEFEDDDDNGEQQQESQQKKQEEKEEDEIAKKLRMAEFARAMKVRFAIATKSVNSCQLDSRVHS